MVVAQPGNDPGRGQRVLQSVGSIAVIVLLAIVCVYARDEGVAGNPLFQHVLPLRQAPVVATFCVIFLLGLNFGDGSILPLAWCGCVWASASRTSTSTTSATERESLGAGHVFH